MTTTLYPTWTLGDLDLTDYPFAVEFGGDHGAPETVSELVSSMIADGDLVRQTRHGNREISLVVIVEGPSLGALAENEAVLRAECAKSRNVLTFEPGDFDSPASVFEVLMVEMRQPRDEVENAHLIHRWELTLTCAPFPRSADLTTTEAFESGTTTVTVDTCTSTAGWTGTQAGAPIPAMDFFEAGSVHVAELDGDIQSPQTWTLTRTGSVNFTTTPFLVVEMKTISYAKGLRVSAVAGGTALPVMESRVLTDGSGYYRVTFDASLAGSVSTLTFSHTSLKGEAWQGLFVREVSRTDVTPGVTVRQTSRIILAGGTERTPANIHVEATTGTDGHGGLTIVHTCPEDGSGYSPPLRRWRTSASTGPEYVDATALSGKWEDINYVAGGFNAKVPTSSLPEGGYVLMARLRSATASLNEGTLYWSTSTIIGNSIAQQGYTNGNVKVSLTSTPALVPVAALSLPSVRTRSGQVEISLQAMSSGAQIQFDDAWLFRADDDCALTIVSNWQVNLWLDSPDVTSPVPRVWIGPDRASQNHPGSALVAQGNHILSPGGTAVFTASLSDNPATSATFYRRWHSNAAE